MKFCAAKSIGSYEMFNKGAFSILHAGRDFGEKHVSILKQVQPCNDVTIGFLDASRHFPKL